MRLEEYLHGHGGVPPYGYATSLQGDFAPSLERTVPAPEHSPAEYGVYVCDSRGNRTESPVVVSLKILPAAGERTPGPFPAPKAEDATSREAAAAGFTTSPTCSTPTPCLPRGRCAGR